MDKKILITKIKNLTSKKKQLYAAKCLSIFCQENSLQHPSIDLLIAHLNSIENVQNIAQWEHEGALLPLNGRGDPIPEELEALLSKNIKSDFLHLVDYTVEVGIVDLYGALSDLPIQFIEKIIIILEKHNITLPKP
ncbi:hypothetical protein AAFM71_11960 [Chromobacterium violaceum]|uniref:hypothetical protein n=1 Tax=Chromobacterium violaceum TaxID=536 RepID=UPI00385A142B